MPCVCSHELGYHSSPTGACVKCECPGYKLAGYRTVRLVAQQPRGSARARGKRAGVRMPVPGKRGSTLRIGDEAPVIRCITMPPSAMSELERLGNGSVSAGFRKLYAEWKASQELARAA